VAVVLPVLVAYVVIVGRDRLVPTSRWNIKLAVVELAVAAVDIRLVR
jgi:hypothetical protein